MINYDFRDRKFPWDLNSRNSGSAFQHPPLVLVLLEVPSFPENSKGNSESSDFNPKIFSSLTLSVWNHRIPRKT